MISARLGFRGVTRQGWGLLLVIAPIVLLSAMIAFVVAAEVSVRQIVKPGITERAIRLGVVDGYPALGSWYTAADVHHVAQIPGVEVGPAAFFACYVDSTQKTELECAVTNRTYLEARENGVTPALLEQWDREKTGMLVVSQIANRHGWKVGDLVHVFPNFPGVTKPMDVVVSGILQGSLSTHAVFIHSEYVHDVYPDGPAVFWSVWVVVDKAERRQAVLEQLDADLSSIHRPHTIWNAEDTNDLILSSGSTMRRAFEIAGAFSLLLVACISVALLIVSVERRKTEFAALIAIGYRRGILVRSIFVQSVLVLVVSSALGAIGMALLFHEHPLRVDVVVSVTVSLSIAYLVAFGGAVLGLLAAIVPAWRLYRLDVLSSLR